MTTIGSDPILKRDSTGARGELALGGLLAGLLMFLATCPALAEDSDTELAKQTQNPVADLISVPIQNNMSYGAGPRERTQNVLNIQPVIPINVTEEWNLITRTILPIVSQPSFVRGQDRETGIGDTTLSIFLSPKKLAFGKLVWGAGPVFNVPTASDDRLGSDKWGSGLTAVALVMGKSLVAGALVNNVWSLEGESSSQFLIQPFLNFNFPRGWYVSAAPIVTANWDADDNAWLVPVGGGFGKLQRIGRLPVNLSVQAFYNAEKPKFGPDWSTRLQVQFLFPK
jgi:hypothetical protein